MYCFLCTVRSVSVISGEQERFAAGDGLIAGFCFCGSECRTMVHGCFDGFPCAVVFPCDLFDGFSCEELFSEVVAELCMVAPYHQGASAAVRMTGSRVCSFAVR